MFVFPDKPISIGWKPCKKDFPQLQAALFAKIVFKLTPGVVEFFPKNEFPVTGDENFDGDPNKSLRYDSDFAPFKPRADVMLVGTVHSPSGRAVPECQARLRVGQMNKTIDVIGDRVWEGNVWYNISKPKPFVSMPMRYEQAFGGANSRNNPVGKGFGQALPNLEQPNQRIKAISDRPAPACFGPISAAWPNRAGMIGTYGERYIKERWPWLPADFDWAHFNAAPRDQQIEGYLRGDEPIELVNLHPKLGYIETKLPGLRVRWFLKSRQEDGTLRFLEVPLVLDTLWIDTDKEQLALIWRGRTPIRSIRMKELEQMLIVTEPLQGTAKGLDYYEKLLTKRFNEGDEEFAAQIAVAKKQIAEAEEQAKDAKKRGEEAAAQAQAKLDETGPRPETAPAAPPSMAEMCARIGAEIENLKAQGVPADDPRLLKMQADHAQLEKARAEMPDPSPKAREAVAEAARTKQSLAQANLIEADLSGLDLSGMDLSQALLINAKLAGCKLVGTNLKEAVLQGADLSQADLTGACLDQALFIDAKLTGAKLIRASMNFTVIMKADLKGADLVEAAGEQAMLFESSMPGVDFSRSKLLCADFSKSDLEGARFIKAELRGSNIAGAKAAKIDMEEADLSGLQSRDKTDYTGANFRKARGKKSVWLDCILDEADFSRVEIEDGLFMDSSLKGTNCDRAILSRSNFSDADLRKIVATRANLLQTIFDRANLNEGNFRGSNLFEASFWEATTERAEFREANLKRTSLG